MPNFGLQVVRNQITAHATNKHYLEKGWLPVYTASAAAKIVIIGQAPGSRAQESNVPWNDVSGDKLRQWLHLDRDMFYDESKIALIPMDFYYPGKGKHGDLPPRKDFAAMWHEKLFKNMPNIQLKILIGQYAQKYYLASNRRGNLTETVRSYKEYLPEYLPLVHPSPLNYRWRTRNPWFETEVVPVARRLVHGLLNTS